MLLFTIYFLQNVWDKLFLALIALKVYTKSSELNDKYKDELESEIKYKNFHYIGYKSKYMGF
jgi:hypothetical protein